jgi:hypothetical protein
MFVYYVYRGVVSWNSKGTLEGGVEPPTLWLTATRSNHEYLTEVKR